MRKLLAFLGLAACAQVPVNTEPSIVSQRVQKIYTITEYEAQPGLRLTVGYTPRVLSFMIFNYADRKNEIPFCVFGEREGTKYKVDDLTFPHILSSTDTSASFHPCSGPRYLGMMHNHTKDYPDGSCYAGSDDFERLINDRNAKLEIVNCRAYVNPDPTEPHLQRTSVLFKELIPADIIRKYQRKK